MYLGFDTYEERPAFTEAESLEERTALAALRALEKARVDGLGSRSGPRGYDTPHAYYEHPSVEPGQEIGAWLRNGLYDRADLIVQAFNVRANGPREAIGVPKRKAVLGVGGETTLEGHNLAELTHSERLRFAEDLAATVNLICDLVGVEPIVIHPSLKV